MVGDKMEDDKFIQILSRTSQEVKTPEGVITVRNCGNVKIMVTVSWKANGKPKIAKTTGGGTTLTEIG